MRYHLKNYFRACLKYSTKAGLLILLWKSMWNTESFLSIGCATLETLWIFLKTQSITLSQWWTSIFHSLGISPETSRGKSLYNWFHSPAFTSVQSSVKKILEDLQLMILCIFLKEHLLRKRSFALKLIFSTSLAGTCSLQIQVTFFKFTSD